jgi:nucleoid-associated protein YgaU
MAKFIPPFYRGYPLLMPTLIKIFDEIKVEMIRGDTAKTLPADFPQLTAYAAFKSATDWAVVQVERTVAALEKDDAFIHQFLHMILNCKGAQTQRVRKQLLLDFRQVLQGKFALRSPYTIYGYLGEQGGPAAVTNTRTGGDKTDFSREMIDEYLLPPYNESFFHAELYRDHREKFIKTLIHEAIHRNLGNQINEFPWDEIYGHDNPEKFAQMTCDEHLENADSFATLAIAIPQAKLYNPTVVGGPIGVQLKVDIYQHDNLWNISKRIFLDGTLWEMIWEENKDHLRSGNPNLVYPGETLTITIPDE